MRVAPDRATVLVDAHVHLHPCYDEGRFFDASLDNFTVAAGSLAVEGPWRGALVLTEVAGVDRFAGLLSRVGGAVGAGWTVEPTAEEVSVRLRSDRDEADLTMVSGRQVQTAEGLEVLAFPLRGSMTEGRPIAEVIQQTADRGAVAVVPWGFGKWTGRRGRTLRALLDEEPGLPFLLADTGHRPRWMPDPPQLAESELSGRPVLTGSDPLPLAGEEQRPGSCCFLIRADGYAGRPAQAVREAISALDRSPRRHERRVGVGRFVASQVAMQIRKRTR